MKKTNSSTSLNVLLAVVTSVILAACGGDDGMGTNAGTPDANVASLMSAPTAEVILADFKQKADAEQQLIANSTADWTAARSGMDLNAAILRASLLEKRQAPGIQ